MIDSPTKQCSKCREIKKLDQFYKNRSKNRSKKDGLQSYCKTCDNGFSGSTLICTNCNNSFVINHRNIRKRIYFLCPDCTSVKVKEKVTEQNKKRAKPLIYTDKGYAYERDLTKKHGYILNHRRIMEKELGRPLTDKEVVHHIDAVRTNNLIENLFLTDSSGHAKAHQSLEIVSLFLYDKGFVKFDRDKGVYVLDEMFLKSIKK